MGTLQYNDTCRMVPDRHTVKFPLRVNWGDGWSDTPPMYRAERYRAECGDIFKRRDAGRGNPDLQLGEEDCL